MANNTISQVTVNNETYDLMDANILNKIYPIGSIYMSVNNVSPSSFIGGTWARIEDRFLLAAGSSYTAGATGGEATHKLTAAESGVPVHAHTVPKHGHGHTNPTVKMVNHVHSMTHGHAITQSTTTGWQTASGQSDRLIYGQVNSARSPRDFVSIEQYTGNTGNPTSLPNCTVSGGGVSDKDAFNTNNNTAAAAANAHNNMPPYLAVYIWKRTA